MKFELKEKTNKGNTLKYQLLDDADILLGYAQIRLKSTKSSSMPEGFESNMGYEIIPEFQGKGYGTKLFNLAMEKVFEHGVNEPIITCGNDNLRSKKIIESAGGILLEQKRDKKGYVINKYTFKK